MDTWFAQGLYLFGPTGGGAILALIGTSIYRGYQSTQYRYVETGWWTGWFIGWFIGWVLASIIAWTIVFPYWYYMALGIPVPPSNPQENAPIGSFFLYIFMTPIMGLIATLFLGAIGGNLWLRFKQKKDSS
ncbi:MAG: hypothetical protein AAF629_27655 [Chloroflexota bacterium]